MKSRWLTLFACVPLAVGTMLLQSCGGVGGPTKASTSPGSNAPTQAFAALLPASQKGAKVVGPSVCGQAACHGGTAAAGHPYANWEATAHAKNKVTCESCHGPGSIHAANPTAKDGTPNGILTFPNSTSPAVCGQCHGPEHDDYMTSAHSQVISTPITETVSSPASTGQSSQCMLCHGGLIRAEYLNNGVTPEQMTTTQITNACNDILNTVPNSATCTTCHDPHSKTGNLTGNGNEAQLYQSEVLTDPTLINPNTTPDQYTRPNQVCGQCHNGRGTTATDAYLAKNTSRPSAHHSNQFNSLLGVGGAEDWNTPPQRRTSSHSTAPGQCATCHMPSSRHTFTVSYDGCAPCHTATDAASRATSEEDSVSTQLLALANRMSNWALSKGYGAQSWDYTSNIPTGQTVPTQSTIPAGILEARHNYYYIVISGDLGVHNVFYTQYLLDWSNTALTNAGIPKVDLTEFQKIPTASKVQHFKQLKKALAKSSMD